MVDRRAFADDQLDPAFGAAAVIGGELGLGAAGGAHAALHRGHHEAVGQREPLQAVRREQRRWLRRRLGGGTHLDLLPAATP